MFSLLVCVCVYIFEFLFFSLFSAFLVNKIVVIMFIIVNDKLIFEFLLYFTLSFSYNITKKFVHGDFLIYAFHIIKFIRQEIAKKIYSHLKWNLYNFFSSSFHSISHLSLSSVAYGNRVKFDTTASKIIPSSNSPSSQGIDQCYDQGYGSERSPEEEVLPPLPLVEQQQQQQQQYGTMLVNSMPQGLLNANNNTNQMFVELDYGQKYQQQQHYDFITEGK